VGDRLLADAVVVVHLLFIAFALGGAALVLLRPWVAFVHLPAAAWAAYVEFSATICPLTPLENTLRARAGTRLVRKRHAAGGVLKALHDRELLVLPFDQNSTRGLGVFVDFFGKPASTNSGIARLALRSGAPAVPVFIVREGRSARHRVHVLPIMYVQRSGDLESDVTRITQELSDVFEGMVRRHPEQWLWVHKRWKTRPPGEPKVY